VMAESFPPSGHEGQPARLRAASKSNNAPPLLPCTAPHRAIPDVRRTLKPFQRMSTNVNTCK
jgi:hypothetical protein